MPSDFFVEEIGLYPAQGEGAHLYVQFEKTGLTTDEAVRRLAAHARVNVRDIGVPGMKDRHAVTIQTVSLPAPVSSEFDAHVLTFQDPSLRILSAKRHNNKLRTGHLRGNRFRIVVRGIPASEKTRVETALQKVADDGVPNAYGTQRFGSRGDNVDKALAWLQGGPAPRDFHQRKFLYSALQSHLFNEVLLARANAGTWNKALSGDILLREDRVLASQTDAPIKGDGPPEAPRENRRDERPGLRLCEDAAEGTLAVDAGDYSPSGPMFGPEMRIPKGDVFALEQAIQDQLLGPNFDWTPTRKFGEGTRRALRLRVEDVRFSWGGTDAQSAIPSSAESLLVEFVLPKGAYATTVLSNVFQLADESRARSVGPSDGQP